MKYLYKNGIEIAFEAAIKYYFISLNKWGVRQDAFLNDLKNFNIRLQLPLHTKPFPVHPVSLESVMQFGFLGLVLHIQHGQHVEFYCVSGLKLGDASERVFRKADLDEIALRHKINTSTRPPILGRFNAVDRQRGNAIFPGSHTMAWSGSHSPPPATCAARRSCNFTPSRAQIL